LLLAAALLAAGCASPGPPQEKAAPAEARLGEAFTGKSYRVAGMLRTVIRQEVFPADTAAYLYLNILDARAGETRINCALFLEGRAIKTIERPVLQDGDAILIIQLTLAGCRSCSGDYRVEIRVNGRLVRELSFSILPVPLPPLINQAASAYT